ncbi:MAG: MFS transporter [Clostridium sp.]|nr:MFS transporter [Acetatifactor muris]MCM1526550.1 MFS transporter [Bacteroides sp.]MCM1562324.1 MFS transporter [Clostridium sp.]
MEDKLNKIKKNKMNRYILFWLSQAVSQLGSSMTGFALILWAYGFSRSALTVSLMTFCNYVPYILVSLFAGTVVDRNRKKTVMLAADSVAALGTLAIWGLLWSGKLLMIHVYLVNALIGCANAFQSPASGVAVRMMVPKEKLSNVSGMNSFSGNLIMVLTPVLAAAIYSLAGLNAVLLIDIGSFVFAFGILLFLIPIPEDIPARSERESVFAGCREGFAFLGKNRLMLQIVLTMALINFFSRLTYENILSPMILSRSGADNMALGTVNAVMGAAGIIGGVFVSLDRKERDGKKMIYFSAALSFLFGDLLMGIGRNTLLWCIAGMAASLPIPFVNAGQNVILYNTVPEDMQGRIFGVRNACQYCTIPIAILLGGYLADYVFEPFMSGSGGLAGILHGIVGYGAGSGMATMFLCTGILGFAFSVFAYLRVRKL